jgi:O-antigen/teichoic acid export membrane protein
VGRQMTKSSSNIKMNFIYQSFYKILVVIIPLITSPYLSRVLGAELLGVYSYMLSVVNYFLMIVYLGIDSYGCRSIAQAREKGNDTEIQKLFWEIYGVQLLTGMIALCAYVIFCMFCVTEYKILYIIQGLAVISAVLDINWFFFGTEQFSLTVTRNSIIKILTVVSILLCVRTKGDFVLYVLIMAGSTFLSQIVMWGFLFKEVRFYMPAVRNILQHVKPDIALFLPVIAVSIYHTMDKTMLGLLADYEQSGYYYNADKVINMPLGIVTGLGIVMLPRMSNVVSRKGIQEGNILLKKSFELNIFLASAMTFGIAAVSKEFVPLFFGSGFEPCTTLVMLFAPVIMLKSFSGLIETQYLIPCGNEKIYTIATIAGAIVNLIFNIALIPKLGAIGATLGTLAAEAAVLMFEAFMIKKSFNIFKCIIDNIVYIISGIVMLGAVRFCAYAFTFPDLIKVFLEVGIGAAAYIVCTVPYWYICKTSIFNPYMRKKHISGSKK